MSDSASPSDGVTRRDFLDLVTWSTLAVGAGAIAWPLIDQMNPSADVLALSSTEVDISQVPEGSAITVKWRGKPVFVRNRTAAELARVKADDHAHDLKEPQTDAERTKPGHEPMLVVLGNCTHLGCPVTWFPQSGLFMCPCHGGVYYEDGSRASGPPPRGLFEYSYKLEGGRLWIKAGQMPTLASPPSVASKGGTQGCSCA